MRLPEDHGWPTKYEVCPECRGKGASSAYLGAFTAEDVDELGPEWMEDYTAGRYDRPCQECNGLRVVEILDRDQATPEQVEDYEDWLDGEADIEAMYRMERMLGA